MALFSLKRSWSRRTNAAVSTISRFALRQGDTEGVSTGADSLCAPTLHMPSQAYAENWELGAMFKALKAYFSTLILATVCLAFAGCASTPELEANAKTNLGPVRIDQPIYSAKEMYYLGPNSGFGLMFGAVGGVAVAIANQSPGQKLQAFAEANGIHIDQIVREEAAKAFQDSGKIKLTDDPNSKGAVLKISVPMYGFSIPTGFSSHLVPVIKIECALVAPDGTIIWKANDSVLPLGNPAKGITTDEIKQNPKLIEDSWRTAVRAIMEKFASNI